MTCATGCELVGYGTGTAEQVQDIEPLELELIVKNIEQSLLGEVCCRPRLEIRGSRYGLSPKYATYYPHIYVILLYLHRLEIPVQGHFLLVAYRRAEGDCGNLRIQL